MNKNRYKSVISHTFNQKFFDCVFDHSRKLAEAHVHRITPEFKYVLNYDYKSHWERIYKEEFELQKDKSGCFVEIYENECPVGYTVGRIENTKFITNTFLSGKRAATDFPLVVDPQLWHELMIFIKEQGCDEYICETYEGGSIWKALKIITRGLRYPVNFKIGTPYSTMSMRWVAQ